MHLIWKWAKYFFEIGWFDYFPHFFYAAVDLVHATGITNSMKTSTIKRICNFILKMKNEMNEQSKQINLIRLRS